MAKSRKLSLLEFGFVLDRNSSHTARTMMVSDLTLLLDWVEDPTATRQSYIDAIVEKNCLRKTSISNRRISARHLIELYGLDPSVTIFRPLRFLWERDEQARAHLALLSSYVRDSILHEIAAKIVELPLGISITREHTERWINELQPGRFSGVTLASVAKNINSTWTQAGYLTGKVHKARTKSQPSAGAVTYALFLAYLSGARGIELFHTKYVTILDCSVAEAMDLAQDASRFGWITFRRVAQVIDISFPNFLNLRELELLREQNR